MRAPIWIPPYLHTYIPVHTHYYTYTYTHTLTLAPVHILIYKHTYTHVCMQICTYVWISILCVFAISLYISVQYIFIKKVFLCMCVGVREWMSRIFAVSRIMYEVYLQRTVYDGSILRCVWGHIYIGLLRNLFYWKHLLRILSIVVLFSSCSVIAEVNIHERYDITNPA